MGGGGRESRGHLRRRSHKNHTQRHGFHFGGSGNSMISDWSADLAIEGGGGIVSSAATNSKFPSLVIFLCLAQVTYILPWNNGVIPIADRQ